jgi:hypothetical protein
MRIVTPLVALVAVLGCASPPRPPGSPPPSQASQVVELPRDRTARCRLLAAVEGAHANGANVAENEETALLEVRAGVAKLGGNAFVVTKRTSGVWRSVVQADAFLCPTWEPVPGLAPG